MEEVWLQTVRAFGSEEKAFVFGTFLVHELVFIIGNVWLAILYHFQWPFFEQFRIQKGKFPPKSLIWTCLRLALVNHLLYIPAMLLSYQTFKKAGMTSEAPLPSWMEVGRHILVNMIIEDFGFYWMHRFLHWRVIYKHIHKMHHQFNYSIGIASEYAHPVEFLLSNTIPFTLGSMLQGSHMMTFWIWTALRVAETIDGHSGSPFAWLPFTGGPEKHDYHHSNNIGNFGSFFNFWDWACGTNLAYKKHLQHKSEKINNATTKKAQ